MTTNEQLAERFQAGDSNAFDELRQRNSKMVASLAGNIFAKDAPALLPHVDAVVNDAFAELRCTKDRFIAGRMVAPWLIGLTSNIAHAYVSAR
jgi:hypothetical protein